MLLTSSALPFLKDRALKESARIIETLVEAKTSRETLDPVGDLAEALEALTLIRKASSTIS
jgi:hypothetical protein